MIARILGAVSIALAAVCVGLWVTVHSLAAQRDAALSEARYATQWEMATYDLQVRLHRCQAQWTTARDTADDALAQLALATAKVDIQREAERSRWESRSLTCRESLNAMQAACEDEIGEY